MSDMEERVTKLEKTLVISAEVAMKTTMILVKSQQSNEAIRGGMQAVVEALQVISELMLDLKSRVEKLEASHG